MKTQMEHVLRVLAVLVCVSGAGIFPSTAMSQTAQTTPEILLEDATKLYLTGQDTNERDVFVQTRQKLDRIVNEFPASDLAVRILLQDKIGELDVAELDRQLSAAPKPVAPVAPAAPQPLPGATPQASGQTDTAASAETPAPGTATSPRPGIATTALQAITNALQPSGGAEPEATPDEPETATQPRDVEPVIPSVSINPDGQQEQIIKMALGTCFRKPSNIPPSESVAIEFALDGAGHLSGIPKRVGTSAETAQIRRLFLSGIVALEDCSPYPNDGQARDLKVVFTAGGVKSVERVEAPKASPAQPVVAAVQPSVVPPKPNFVVATKLTENAMKLDRDKRREIQRRLTLLGFDTNGVDGVFGANTRTAISSWQEANGMPDSGFLSGTQLLALNQESEALYVDYIAKNPVKKKTAKKKRKRRVKVCRRTAIGLLICRYEYRWY
ncbi:peptidoglycan-binding protein [Alisedimentitalea sp. MJ-SS2]|uniref:peptidoglycan-binding protein n=1 Tax=Aliisedimentitalea sp. MJ-SS2 TaxID=3049795 RepID=UPI00290EC2E0|nr:peptidoglycan-binding protein [Alisedimentitalea sp. MJ-SS2]MDU8927691.1 peptidoglycan-binding protein [Alisedimentitalea sp. MJ-SS2]